MMLRVILCDDDRDFLERLCGTVSGELARMQVEARLYPFSEPESIPDSVLSGCDMALLDIDYAGKSCNGIDIARRVRARRTDAVILFVTNYIEYAPSGYEVNAFRYVLKNEIHRKLPEYLPQALEQMRSTRETLTISSGGEQIDIALPEILWMESRQHTVTIYTRLREYRCYRSLSALEEELTEKGFLRVHNSFLVNMAHLRKYSSTEAVLSDGTVLRVSARSYGEKKKQYLMWKGRLG